MKLLDTFQPSNTDRKQGFLGLVCPAKGKSDTRAVSSFLCPSMTSNAKGNEPKEGGNDGVEFVEYPVRMNEYVEERREGEVC